MLKNGYIKLHRRMLDWEWYHDVNTKVVFLHLLLTANIKDEKWRGEEIKRGSRVISYQILADELNLTIRQARTALEHLKTTGEVTVKTTAKYSVVTVLNYNHYQGATGNLTGKRQAIDTMGDSQATGNRQQYKKTKEEKEIREDRERARACVVSPSLLNFFDSELHISGRQLEQDLIYFFENGATESLIREAVTETVRKGKKYGYTKGILETCIREGKQSISAGKGQRGSQAGPASYDLESFERLGFHVPGAKHEG